MKAILHPLLNDHQSYFPMIPRSEQTLMIP